MSDIVETLQQEKKMTPKQVEIIRAAIELIAEKGYYNTSTSEIAKRAGVAEGTIFRHYRTKKELLMEIVNPVIINFSVPLFAEKFVDQVFYKEHQCFEDFLYAFIKNRYAFGKANTPLLKILAQELAFHPEIKQTFKSVFQEKVYPVFSRALDFYKKKGELQVLSNDVMIRTIVSTVLGFMMNRFFLQPDRQWDDEAEIERTIGIIMGGIGKG